MFFNRAKNTMAKTRRAGSRGYSRKNRNHNQTQKKKGGFLFKSVLHPYKEEYNELRELLQGTELLKEVKTFGYLTKPKVYEDELHDIYSQDNEMRKAICEHLKRKIIKSHAYYDWKYLFILYGITFSKPFFYRNSIFSPNLKAWEKITAEKYLEKMLSEWLREDNNTYKTVTGNARFFAASKVKADFLKQWNEHYFSRKEGYSNELKDKYKPIMLLTKFQRAIADYIILNDIKKMIKETKTEETEGDDDIEKASNFDDIYKDSSNFNYEIGDEDKQFFQKRRNKENKKNESRRSSQKSTSQRSSIRKKN